MGANKGKVKPGKCYIPEYEREQTSPENIPWEYMHGTF
jgi:hypothetical protein